MTKSFKEYIYHLDRYMTKMDCRLTDHVVALGQALSEQNKRIEELEKQIEELKSK